ncbi:SusD family protein [compost metagenome]
MESALDVVLKERRKELLFRGLRWTDLRRLNLDPTTARTPKRELDGKIYTIEPNSPNYVYPFPDNVIQLAGLIQNERN